MKVRVLARLNPDAADWDVERWTVRSEFPEVSATSQGRDAAVNFVIGAVLHALGDRPVPPRHIHFEVIDVDA